MWVTWILSEEFVKDPHENLLGLVLLLRASCKAWTNMEYHLTPSSWVAGSKAVSCSAVKNYKILFELLTLAKNQIFM